MNSEAHDRKAFIKSVKLLPTLFTLDVFIHNELEVIQREIDVKYKIKYNWDGFPSGGNGFVDVIESSEKSHLKGEKRIVMGLCDFQLSVLVHEIVHVMHHLAYLTKIDATSEEWVAYMSEYIFREILDSAGILEWQY